MPSAVQNNTVYELFNSVTICALSIWAREIVQDCSSRVFETTCARHVQVASPFLESPERPVVYPHCEAASAAVIAVLLQARTGTTAPAVLPCSDLDQIAVECAEKPISVSSPARRHYRPRIDPRTRVRSASLQAVAASTGSRLQVPRHF